MIELPLPDQLDVLGGRLSEKLALVLGEYQGWITIECPELVDRVNQQ